MKLPPTPADGQVVPAQPGSSGPGGVRWPLWQLGTAPFHCSGTQTLELDSMLRCFIRQGMSRATSTLVSIIKQENCFV